VPGLWCSVPLAQADKDEGGHPLQPGAWCVPTLAGGKLRWSKNNGKSCSNPSWCFAVVSLALARSLHGYEGQCHRKRGALAGRALDVDRTMMGQDDLAYDIEPQACPF